MKQHDVVRLGEALGVVIDSDLLPYDRYVVVIPLIEDYPTAGALNPVIAIGEAPHVLATRLITHVRRDRLSKAGMSVETDRDAITRAIDILIGGV